MKISPVGAELFHTEGADGRTDRQTDMTKLIVLLCNFANVPENYVLLTQCTVATVYVLYGTDTIN